ncbi:T9SS type A sorting domain-containing protein [Bacteroidota bacterium]
MKKFYIAAFLFMISINVFAQYPELTIMDIQFQSHESLLTNGDLPSPWQDSTVTITGVVMVAPNKYAHPDSGQILHNGAPSLVLQDTSETDFAGILVRFANSTPAFDFLDTGNVIQVTGVVDEYFKTTQFNLIGFENSSILGNMIRPQPVLITLDSLAEFGLKEGIVFAERWEDVAIEVENVTATVGGIGSGSYEVFDENNTQVVIGNESDYFRNNSTVPAPGTILSKIRGHIQNRDNVPGTNFANLIMPEYPGDVVVASFPPSISDVTRDLVEVGYGDPVNISATMEDPDGTVIEATLYYRKNLGVQNSLNMTNTSGNTWTATIPAQNDSSLMDFFITAEDDSGFVSITPADTSRNRFFYLVLDRPLTIQDVQYSPFGSGFSGYNSFEVTVRGIVTADTTDIKGNQFGSTGVQVYIQNGSGPWSGINIMGTETLLRQRGDDITVTGTVGENFGLTQITGIDPGNLQLHSSGNALPDPKPITTDIIGQMAGGEVDAEQWEGVLVKYQNITVTDANADGEPMPDQGSGGNRNFGDILVADASTTDTRIGLQDGTHQYHNFWIAELENEPILIGQGDTFNEVIGILWYAFSNYKLLPRKDDDFVGHTTGTEEEIGLPGNYELAQNYPNPFNPSTKIQFALPVGANVTLKVFNLLGQEVQTLINNQVKPAGSHEVIFDASNLPSGIYFYRMQTDNFVQVKKMMLLK